VTKQERDRARDWQAMGLLSRSGVGFVFATHVLDPEYMAKVATLGNAPNVTEAMVKVALQFAFTDQVGFRRFIDMEIATDPYARKFRAKA